MKKTLSEQIADSKNRILNGEKLIKSSKQLLKKDTATCKTAKNNQ